MSSSNLISNVYFFILFVILISLFLIITFQIIKLIFLEISYRRVKNKKFICLTEAQIFHFVYLLIQKKMWFKAVKLLESKSLKQTEKNAQYLNAVGFLYYKMEIYNLANKYYLKAISIYPSYIVALSNLANVYSLQDKKELALKVYQDILNCDPTNKVAKMNVAKLKSRDSRI